AAHPDANIIFGAVIDDTLGDEVKVTVIAAGFDSGQLPYKKVDIRREPAAQSRLATSAASAVRTSSADSTAEGYGRSTSSPATSSANGSRSPLNLDEELDVPEFLKY